MVIWERQAKTGRLRLRPGWLMDEVALLAEPTPGGAKMLYTLAVILLIAWLLGVVGTYTVGAFIHVLLVIAIVLFVVGLVSGRRTIV
jgi:uncharacterized membrane protein YtjA (UPF0391 family)